MCWLCPGCAGPLLCSPDRLHDKGNRSWSPGQPHRPGSDWKPQLSQKYLTRIARDPFFTVFLRLAQAESKSNQMCVWRSLLRFLDLSAEDTGSAYLALQTAGADCLIPLIFMMIHTMIQAIVWTQLPGSARIRLMTVSCVIIPKENYKEEETVYATGRFWNF